MKNALPYKLAYFFCFTTVAGILACNRTTVHKTVPVTEPTPVIQYYSFKSDSFINKAVVAYDNIIVLLRNRSFICFNSHSLEPDSIALPKLKNLKADELYRIHDTLVLKIDNKYFFLDSAFNLLPYNAYKNLRYNQNHYIIDSGEDLFYAPSFSDSLYDVFSFCSGEFGGTSYFFEKQGDKEYFFMSTCAACINKINGKYYATSSNEHMAGSSEVDLIENPKNLNEIDFDTIQNFYRFWTQKFNHQSGLKNQEIHDSIYSAQLKGINVLFDKQGVTIYSSFVFKDQLYHIFKISNEIHDSTEFRYYLLNKMPLYLASLLDPEYKYASSIKFFIFNKARYEGLCVGVIKGNVLYALSEINDSKRPHSNYHTETYNNSELYSIFSNEHSFYVIRNDTIHVVKFE